MSGLICTEEFMLIPAMIRYRGQLLVNRVHGKPTWRDTLTVMEGETSTRVMYLARNSGGLALTAIDSEFVDFIKVFGLDSLVPGEHEGAHLTIRNITLEDAEYYGILEDGRMISIAFLNKTLLIRVHPKGEWTVENEHEFFGVTGILGVNAITSNFKMNLLMESVPLGAFMYSLEQDHLVASKFTLTETECREMLAGLDEVLEELK